MREKDELLRKYTELDEAKHKKKSKAKGEPRADHKHEYIMARVFTPYYNEFTKKTVMLESITKICHICGRVHYAKSTDEYYDAIYEQRGKYRMGKKVLNKKGEALPEYYKHDFFDKTAYRGE